MKLQKKIYAFVMTLALMITMLCSTAIVYNSATATIDYTYTGRYSENSGFAQGTIKLTANPGTYWLYWADDSKALDGYTEIAKLTVNSGSATHYMYDQTAIPADATKLIAIQSTSEPATKTVAAADAVYTIPASKRLGHKSSDKKYSFASYSDIHMDSNLSAYKYCKIHFEKALQTAANRNVDFIVGSGDYAHSEGGSASVQAKDWKLYQKVLAESEYCNPIYEAIGNHELWPGAEVGTKNFINATGLEGSNNTATKAYFEKTLNGDHFIFMSLEAGFYPDRTDEFSTEQLDWLEGLLKKYSGDGKNIYIIEHSLFYKYGAGDTTTGTPYYDIPLSDNQPSTRRFKSLLETYKDTIFISGHTHIAFSEQFNYSDNDNTSGQMIHNSSVGGTRHIENGSLKYIYYEDQTEGYIVDVYDNGIIFNGANLYYNEYDPNCCYLVRTSQQAYESMKSTEAVTKATTAPQTLPSQSDTKTSYYLKGTFNGWGTSNPFYETSDPNVISTVMNLNAGTYTFKINNGSTWYGNSGTIEDTTKKTSKGGWVMNTSDGDCSLKATGGYYTFTFDTSTKKLNVLYSTAVETQPTTEGTEPETTEPTATSPEKHKLGDVNGDGKINVSDATVIQKYAAELITLTDAQIAVADTNNDGLININDATLIQRYAAELITSFNVPKAKSSLYSTGLTLADTKKYLDLYYRYSSYDCYQALKKAYKNGESDAAINSLVDSLLKVVDPSNVDGAVKEYTVYFENKNNWSKVYAYCWTGESHEASWPGKVATYVGKNSAGTSIYSYKINVEEYGNIVFSNGSGLQTKDIELTDNNICYYPTNTADKATVSSYSFNSSMIVR